MEKRIFTAHTKLFLSISAAIVVVAILLSLFGYGMNLGIDFTGGSLLNYSVGESYNVSDVESILNEAGYAQNQITKAAPSDASIALVEAARNDGTFIESDNDIADDGMYDLQVRLNLVDNSEANINAVTEALSEALGDPSEVLALNAAAYASRAINTDFIGGQMYTFALEEGYDLSAMSEKVIEALDASGVKFDDVRIEKATEASLAETTDEEDSDEDAVDESEAEPTEAPVEETESTDDESESEASEEAAETDEEAAEETESSGVTTAELADGTSVTIADADAGNQLVVLITLNDQTSLVRKTLETEMTAKYPNFSFVSIEHVSATSGRDLISNAVKSILIVFVCLLIYIGIRFDLFSGLATLFGLLHDVLVMCAFMVFFRGFFQVNSPFIAAVLTIVGYSINNTIIVFDRIREVAKRPGASQRSRKDIVEEAVGKTLTRTINTSLTTLFTLVALFAFGVDSIREFAFPLIVGMLAGTYSSVLLSGQVWAFIMDKRAEKKKA